MLTRGKVLSLGVDALVVVDVVLLHEEFGDQLPELRSCPVFSRPRISAPDPIVVVPSPILVLPLGTRRTCPKDRTTSLVMHETRS